MDEASLMQAIAEGHENINLGADITITRPIQLTNGMILQLELHGFTLTSTGSMFQANGEANIILPTAGTLKANGCLVIVRGDGRITVSQINGTVIATTLFDRPTDWSYGFMDGSLSLSQTVEMGAGTMLSIARTKQLTSTASGSAVHLTNASADLQLNGTLSASGNGVAMDQGTNLTMGGGATLDAGGDAIVAGPDCRVTIGGQSSVSAGRKKAVFVAVPNSGTSVSSGPNVGLSDGTIANYLDAGTIVKFEGGTFHTAAITNPQAQGWYGEIDNVWCPTKADYDTLYALLHTGGTGNEEVVEPGPGEPGANGPSVPGTPGAPGVPGVSSGPGAAGVGGGRTGGTGGATSIWNASMATSPAGGTVGASLEATFDGNAATTRILALAGGVALTALLLSRTNLFLATNAAARGARSGRNRRSRKPPVT